MKSIKILAGAALLASILAGCMAQKDEAFESETAGEREVPRTDVFTWQ